MLCTVAVPRVASKFLQSMMFFSMESNVMHVVAHTSPLVSLASLLLIDRELDFD